MEPFETSAEWLRAHPAFVRAMVVTAFATSIGSIIVVPLILARLPADYFTHDHRVAESRHPVIRILKNVIGFVLVIAGLAMLVLPGQGLLTLLAGLILVEFPGKQRLERRFVQRPPVLHALNWIRAKAGRGPLIV